MQRRMRQVSLTDFGDPQHTQAQHSRDQSSMQLHMSHLMQSRMSRSYASGIFTSE
jgi:hypothetical protein